MLVTKDDYEIDDDPARLDLDVVHGFLTRSYWAEGVPRGVVERSVANSLNLGLYHGGSQVGFTRAVTDRATFAWVCDVFVLPGHQGRGLGHWMIETLQAHPDLAGLRRFMLATADAHRVYADCGFTPLADPRRWMEITRPTRELYGPSALLRPGCRAGGDGSHDVVDRARRVEVPQRPGGPGAGELVHVAALEGRERDIEAVQRAALAGYEFEHRAEQFRGAVGREQPVQPGCPLERARLTGTGGGAPQGRPGLLERPGQERDSVGAVVPARVADLGAGPQGEHEFQGFIQFRGQHAGVGVFAEPGQLSVGVDPEAHAEDKAAAGEVIQADRLAREFVRPPAR
jgi:GNAT superfamily N-acetyltransferase